MISSFDFATRQRAGLTPQRIEKLDRGRKEYYKREAVEKIFWSIGEVAEMLKVKPSKIRFWLSYFKVEVKKNGKGFRFFTEQDIEKVKLIYTLRVVEGLELWAARKRFKQLARI